MISKVSGRIYEKRLAETHISEHGTDPVTDEECTVDDLIEINGYTPVVKPRPNSLTSIPSLLGALQTEWDAMALEVFQLRKQLQQTKQELSSALYHHDAAVRVAARLNKERDEARKALAQLSANVGVSAPSTNDEEPQDETMENANTTTTEKVPEQVVEAIQLRVQQLGGKNRKNRNVENSASPDQVKEYQEVHKTKQLFTTVSNHSLNVQGDQILTGGGKSQCGIYSLSEKKLEHTGKCGGNVTATRWMDNGSYAVGLKTGKVEIYDSQHHKQVTFDNHSTKIVALFNSPSGYLISVSENLCAIHSESEVVWQVQLTDVVSAAVHPDGHLLSIGASTGDITFYDLTTGDVAGSYKAEESVNALAISENGFTLAAACGESVLIYHLGKAALLQTIEVGAAVTSVDFDYSSQYLAIASTSHISIAFYNKPAKDWIANQLQFDVNCTAVTWTRDADQLIGISSKGSIHVFSSGSDSN